MNRKLPGWILALSFSTATILLVIIFVMPMLHIKALYVLTGLAGLSWAMGTVVYLVAVGLEYTQGRWLGFSLFILVILIATIALLLGHFTSREGLGGSVPPYEFVPRLGLELRS